MVMIGNSSLTVTRGTINGVSQSQVAVLRFVGPTLASLVLAWSEQNVNKGDVGHKRALTVTLAMKFCVGWLVQIYFRGIRNSFTVLFHC